MRSGWIKIHRKVWDHPRSNDPEFMAVWFFMLCEARFETKKTIFKGHTFKLKPGQFTAGRRQISATTGVNESKVKRIIKWLKSDQQIDQQTSNKFSVFTVLNWEEYQSSDPLEGQQATSKRPASDQQATTPEECKEGKNAKNENLPDKNPVANEPDQLFKDLHRNFPEQKPMGKNGGKKGSIKNAFEAFRKLKEDDRLKRVELIDNYREMLAVNPERPSCSMKAWFGPKAKAYGDTRDFVEKTKCKAPKADRMKIFEDEIWPLVSKFKKPSETKEQIFQRCCELGEHGFSSKQIYDAYDNHVWLNSDEHDCATGFHKKFCDFMTVINVDEILKLPEETLNAQRKEILEFRKKQEGKAWANRS